MNEFRQVTLLTENIDRIFSNTTKMKIEINDLLELTNMNREEKIEFRMEMGLTNEEQTLLALADDMAAAMTNLNSQNYKEFIDSRDRFRGVISQICEKNRKSEERIAKMKEAILAA